MEVSLWVGFNRSPTALLRWLIPKRGPTDSGEIRMSDRNRQLIEGGSQGHAGQGVDSEFVVTSS